MEIKNLSVDIIIPVYNCRNFIDRCLKSILDQKCQEKLRIILVDDGSTDGSSKIVDNYADNFQNIIAIHKKNGGLSSARNAGLELVESDYFTFIDPDDWVSNSYFNLVANELAVNSVDILMTPYIKKYKNTELKTFVFGNRKVKFNKSETKSVVLRRLFGLIGSELQHPLTVDNLSTVWAKIYKSSKFKEVNFTDKSEIYSEDLWFNINCFKIATDTMFLNTVFYIYNKENESSIVHTYHATILEEYTNLYRKMRIAIIDNELGPMFNEALNNRIILNELIMLRNVSKSHFSISKKKEIIERILNDPIYMNCFKNFDFRLLPFTYRIFYKSCEKKNIVIVMLFLLIGESLKKKVK